MKNSILRVLLGVFAVTALSFFMLGIPYLLLTSDYTILVALGLVYSLWFCLETGRELMK